jgi:crotonobetainyl-CoA:carnitine CoA-transferase CaiB-like acyl-CoA transferase
MKTHPTNWWVDRLEGLKIGCGPINTLKQVFADPHVQARGVVVEAPDDEAGSVLMHNVIPRMSETPGRLRSAAPALGQHTRAVLASIGYDAARLAALEAAGAIGGN